MYLLQMLFTCVLFGTLMGRDRTKLREKIEIEPGDTAATREDEEEDYGKRGVRRNQNSPKTRPLEQHVPPVLGSSNIERNAFPHSVPSRPVLRTKGIVWYADKMGRNGEGAKMPSDGNNEEEEGDGRVMILCSTDVKRVVPGGEAE
ncbi:hypothetical protein DVH24_014915 [Malus domestica]|uniref:Uncharacterized protein n=1 Tax=Malus domestica TaxID=3750 RepID=A0A498K290_MALDO|nr:hypothetical protein DVH24_014915 [Malus domestica]